jgi:hypothetical protein
MRKVAIGAGFRSVPSGKRIRIMAAGGCHKLVKITATTGRNEYDGDE